jgi:hypothetical protein
MYVHELSGDKYWPLFKREGWKILCYKRTLTGKNSTTSTFKLYHPNNPPTFPKEYPKRLQPKQPKWIKIWKDY